MSTGLFKDRLTLDLTYYDIKDENQIIDLDVSEASGFDSRKVNGNEYTTHGFEVMLNYSAIKRSTFAWDIGVNWTRYVKTLTSIYNNNPKFGNLKVGDRADAYYATVWQKSASGELILSESNGLPIRDPYPGLLGHIEPS